MYDCNKGNKQIENFIEGYTKLTQEYKSIINSKEYKIGVSFYQYYNLLKKHRYITIFKRIFFKTKKYNNFLKNTNNVDMSFEKYLSNKKIVVYTSIFGSYDKLLEPIIKPDNIDYYIITDQKIPNNSKWQKIEDFHFPENVNSNIEKNRYCKMFPDNFFKEYDYSIYIDGNVLITSDLTPLIENMSEFPISMHRHKNRNCVYEEIDACIKKGKANKKELIKHKKKLIENGVPKHGGLLEATIIARRHNDEKCKSIMQQWWNEFIEYSKRDQISLIDVLWKNNIDIDTIANMGNNTFDNNLFIIIPHKS